MIVLERPAWDHNYMLEFGDFVENSPALKALNELILFAMKSSIMQETSLVCPN
jgi:hypothetical protein